MIAGGTATVPNAGATIAGGTTAGGAPVAPGAAIVGPPEGNAGAESLPADFSYVRLAHPSVAERLKLSDEQRKRVADLLIERADALAKTPAAERANLLLQFEGKLAQVLTEEQRSTFYRRPTEPRLRFNFRFWIQSTPIAPRGRLLH